MMNSRNVDHGEIQNNFFDYLLVGLPEDKLMEIKQILFNFITNVINYDEAKTSYFHLVGNVDLIEKLQNFMNITEDVPSFEYGDDDKSSLKKNKTWTRFEDQRLIAGIHKYGITNWTNICQFVGNGRTRGQCSQRWHRTINPLINKNYWSQDEDFRLMHAVSKYGDKSWAKVASHVTGRTDIQCRYRYQIISKKYAPSPNDSPLPRRSQNVDYKPIKYEKPKKKVDPIIITEKDEQELKNPEICNTLILFDLLKEISSDPSSLFNSFK